MGQVRRLTPDVLSISRIPASLLFLLVFSSQSEFWFYIALAIAAYAIVTDMLDGFLARRWCVVSERGYYLDGLGDKSFTVAICLVVARDFPALSSLMWGLIFREVVLYAFRVIDPAREANQKGLRRYSLVHAGLLRASFLLYFVQVYFALQGSPININIWMLASVFGGTLAVGLVPIFVLSKRIF